MELSRTCQNLIKVYNNTSCINGTAMEKLNMQNMKQIGVFCLCESTDLSAAVVFHKNWLQRVHLPGGHSNSKCIKIFLLVVYLLKDE